MWKIWVVFAVLLAAVTFSLFMGFKDTAQYIHEQRLHYIDTQAGIRG